MRKTACAVLAGLLLAGCGSITVPVAVISDNGDTMHGTTTASLAGGSFEVTGRYAGEELSCSGTYDALDSSKTISMPARCSDGRTGTVVATRDASGLNGSGHVELTDGTRARFVFGNAMVTAANAVSKPQTEAALTTTAPPAAASLPDTKWVAAQSEPYLKCGRKQAARLALLLPDESPADIATTARLRCGSERQRFSSTIRPALPPDMVADALGVIDRNFRDLATAAALDARELARIDQLRPPKAAPPAKPQPREQEA